MKSCSVCKVIKPLTEYLKGYAKCKSCRYEVIKKYRASEAGKEMRKKEAINARLSGKKQIRQKRYEQTEKGKLQQKKPSLRQQQQREPPPQRRCRISSLSAAAYPPPRWTTTQLGSE